MDEQKLVEVQDQYSTALATGNAEEARKLEEQLNHYIENGKFDEKVDPEPSEETSVAGQETTAESTTEGTPEPEKEEPKSEVEDWLASLAPEVKGQVEKLMQSHNQLEHQYKSVNGRVAAYQRRYDELQKKAVQQEELLKKLQATAQPQGNPAASEKNPSVSLDDDPDLKQIAETDEQLARVIRRREQMLNEKISKLENMVTESINPLKQGFEQQQVNSELNRLVQRIPNAIEIFNYRSPEGVNVWDDWVNSQPKGVQTLALSDNADDVARALELYGQDMYRIYGSQQKEEPASQKPVADSEKAAKVQQERERKLQAQPVGSASVRPPQRTEPTLEEIMADPEKLEKYQHKIYLEELKRRGIA
jgi:hypothetical protein